jgi:aryl-alcohol dehydrogenase-like predicted oxidoreductase
MPAEHEAIALIYHALTHGVIWIDTARAYGCAESRAGLALSGGERDRARLVTKLDPLDELPEMPLRAV